MWHVVYLIKRAMEGGGAPPPPPVGPVGPAPRQPPKQVAQGVSRADYLARLSRLQQQGITPQSKPNIDYITNLQSPESIGNIQLNQQMKGQLMPPGR